MKLKVFAKGFFTYLNYSEFVLDKNKIAAYSHCPKMKGKKTEPVPIPFPRAFRNFPDAKTRNKKKFDN